MISLLTYLTTFMIIILAELGDKTQVATLIYSSNNPSKRWQVFLAASLALIACVCLEVTLGLFISRLVSPSLLNRITGFVFIAIGVVTLVNFFKAKNPAPVLERTSTLDQEN